MVAKSYQKMKQLGVPYKDKGKAYVRVMTQKGVEKVVRWYTDEEYAKMYPEEKKDRTKDPYYKPQKYTLGFDKGYITIFRGYKEDLHEEWFKQSICRYARWWGWYVISTQEVPLDLPAGVEPVKLFWDPMGNEEEWLKDEATVKAHVRNTLLEAIKSEKKDNTSPFKSVYQGEVGERLELTVKIIGREEEKNEKYNKVTFTYEMEDGNHNYYKWRTQVKDWSVGTKHHIRGTVKEYDEVNGEEATVLTRCVEVA